MVLETHMRLCVTAGFSRKYIFYTQNCENVPKMGQKQCLEFIEKFGN